MQNSRTTVMRRRAALVIVGTFALGVAVGSPSTSVATGSAPTVAPVVAQPAASVATVAHKAPRETVREMECKDAASEGDEASLVGEMARCERLYGAKSKFERVVSGKRVVPCKFDDGSGSSLPCYWDAAAQGNGRGSSFVAYAGKGGKLAFVTMP